MAALLDRALELIFALTKAGRDSQFRLKLEQKEITEALVPFNKDVVRVLPTGFGKSLISSAERCLRFRKFIYLFRIFTSSSCTLICAISFYFFIKILFFGRFPEQVYAIEDLF